MQIFHLIHHDYPFQVLFLDKVDNLATVGYDFKRAAGHGYLTLFKYFPVLEAMHNSGEDLIEVLVDSGVLITQFFCLVE